MDYPEDHVPQEVENPDVLVGIDWLQTRKALGIASRYNLPFKDYCLRVGESQGTSINLKNMGRGKDTLGLETRA